MANTKLRPLTLPDGSTAYGQEVTFSVTDEQWSSYQLSDGNRLRMKNTVIKVFRIVDENGNGLYSGEGEPQYFVNATALIVASEDETEEE